MAGDFVGIVPGCSPMREWIDSGIATLDPYDNSPALRVAPADSSGIFLIPLRRCPRCGGVIVIAQDGDASEDESL